MYKTIKQKAKLFFKRFKNQNGGVVLTTLAVIGIISLGASLFSFGEKAMEEKKNMVDVTKYSDIKAAGDPGKDQEKNNAAVVEVAVEGGKVGVGVYDDTGLLIILDKSGALGVSGKEDNEDKEKNKEIEKKLKENDLPSDPLMVGIAKVTENKVKRNSNSGATQEDIDEAVIDALGKLSELDELLDSNPGDEDKIGEPEFDIVSHINKILDASGKLANKKVIEIRKELDKTNSEKKYVEMKIKAYKDYEDKGYIVTDASEWSNFDSRLDELNNKISELTAEVQQYEDKPQEISDEESTGNVLTDGEESEEIIEEVAEGVITLTGTIDAPDADTQKMSMTINLDTGSVTGMVYLRYDDGGIWFNVDIPISGSMNLETRRINVISGEVKMTGELSADGKRANGTGSDGIVWKVLR